MPKLIVDFAELKAYVDVFNERGHPGFGEPLNPFHWWNFKWKGTLADDVHAYFDDGLIIVLELENPASSIVKNMLAFALCPQKNIMRKLLDIVKNYGTIIYNSEFGDRYRNITKKLNGACWLSDGRHFYAANGGEAWFRLYGQA